MFGYRIAAVAATLLLSVTCASAAMPNSVTIKMVALNGSGENGMATLTQVPSGVRVRLMLANAPNGVMQPTHIHIGTCANINKAPEYALPNTMNGKNQAIVAGVKLASLLSGHYALNVHKSTSDLKDYVSCGNIVAK